VKYAKARSWQRICYLRSAQGEEADVVMLVEAPDATIRRFR
jgi:hypothetical protein